MQRIRVLIKQRHIACLLLLGITLRSLIASGFMLDTQTDDGLFAITICEGPAGINAIQQDDHHHHHHAHHIADDGQHGTATYEHDMSACHIWSASAQAIAFQEHFSIQSGLFKDIQYSIENHLLFLDTYQYTSLPRAPPIIT